MDNNHLQIYEKYWKYTAAWTDINGDKFRGAMSACIDYYAKNSVRPYSSKDYKNLQKSIVELTRIDEESVRKAINQFVKLGFLKPRMQGIYPEAEEFNRAKSNEGRIIALSKAVYKNANFQNAMSKEIPEWNGQMSFLIRTLTKCGSLSKDDMTAIMSFDFASSQKEYLSKEELRTLYEKAVANGFTHRKYNQIGHLMNLLNKLDNLRKRKGVVYFETDAKELFGDEEEQKSLSKYRDPYLQREFKKELIAECSGKCMVEDVHYPVLIASHIRPYKDCRDNNDWDAAFDVNNGLLLSKNLDSLFDLGYITFEINGDIVTSDELSQDVKEKLKPLKLNTIYINSDRKEYLKTHRKLVFNKRFKKRIVI